MKTEYYVEWRDGRKWKRSGDPESSKTRAINKCRDRASIYPFRYRYRVVCVVMEEVLLEVVYETKEKKL